MRIWGKVLGAFFGFLLGNVIGAAIGCWLGHRFDRGLGLAGPSRRAQDPAQQAVFFHATFAVMGHIAKSSGCVTTQEIQLASNLMDRMQLTGSLRERAQDSFRQGKSAGFRLRETLVQFRQASLGQRDILRFFLEMQLQLAFADGRLEAGERAILQVVADELGFGQSELNRLLSAAEAQMNFFSQEHKQRQRHSQRRADDRQQKSRQQGTGQDEYTHQQSQHSYQHSHGSHEPAANKLKGAYQVLGVSDSASDQDVKRAYRKEMNKHHPDKLAAKGLPPAMMEMAKEKAQEIQQAWEWICRARGIR
ncbi:MAG: co-chaperone DjlA [Aeromonas sp.]